MASSSKSNAWRDFELIFEETGAYSGFAKCKVCKKSLKHHRETSGTTHLRSHIAACKSAQVRRQNNSGIFKFFPKKKELPQHAKEKLCDAVIDFVAEDLRPLSSVEGKGLLKLVDACIDLGAQYGKVEASNVLPSRYTVKRKLSLKADAEKERLSECLKSAIEMNGIIGVTTDIRKDPKGRNFISFTVHYVTEAQMRSRVASVEQFLEEKKTGINIRSALERTFVELGFDLEAISNIFFMCLTKEARLSWLSPTTKESHVLVT